MDSKTKLHISLAEKCGWGIVKKDLTQAQIAHGKTPWFVDVGHGRLLPLSHPWRVALRVYRDSLDANEKYENLVRAHHFLWPEFEETWNKWDEVKFRAHCEGYTPIVLAGGAGISKSHGLARIMTLFWLSDPKHNAGLVASTSVDSLESRIWGYVVKLMVAAKKRFPIQAEYYRSRPPKILHPMVEEKIHGLFAIPIKRGDDETTLSSVIGRHPDRKMMVMLDEGTDMPHAAMKAVPNWEKSVEFFQLWLAGNSNEKSDLHGACATPRSGWDKIDWRKDNAWPTTYAKGLCLYFNPYKSPAINEKNLEKRTKLRTFLIDNDGIAKGVEDYGVESPSFYRFILGFWPPDNISATIATRRFLSEQNVQRISEWSGLAAMHIVAGLDPAFAIGTKGCLLRFGVLGQAADGRIVLDFRKEEWVHRIEVRVVDEKSSERQLSEQVIALLRQMGCPLSSMAIDCSGQGRVLGDLIHALSGEVQGPIKIMSVGGLGKDSSRDEREKTGIILATPSDLWLSFREFVDNRQIGGLDSIAFEQIVSRQIIEKNGKMQIEKKTDYIARMNSVNPKLARSPDEADAVMLCTRAAVVRHGFFKGQRVEKVNVFVNDFWHQKEAARAAEAGLRAQTGVAANARPPLLPNFRGRIDDLAQKPRYRR